jgi:hypothetical protein
LGEEAKKIQGEYRDIQYRDIQQTRRKHEEKTLNKFNP